MIIAHTQLPWPIAAPELHSDKLAGQGLLEHIHLVAQPVTLLAQLQQKFYILSNNILTFLQTY